MIATIRRFFLSLWNAGVPTESDPLDFIIRLDVIWSWFRMRLKSFWTRVTRTEQYFKARLIAVLVRVSDRLTPSMASRVRRAFAIPTPEEVRLPRQYIALGNLFGIKSVPGLDTSKRRDLTCFLLPRHVSDPDPIDFQRDIEERRYKISAKDFAPFWFKLSDAHKERRLLLNYFCLIRDVKRTILNRRRPISDELSLYYVHQARILEKYGEELLTEILCVFRRLFVLEQMQGGYLKFRSIIKNFLDEFSERDDGDPQYQKCVRQYFHGAIRPSFERLMTGPDDLLGERREITEVFRELIAMLIDRVVKSFLGVQLWWEIQDDFDQERYLKKLRTAAVHWRKEEREILLKMSGDGLSEYRNTYAGRIMKSGGLKWFKHIAFGKEKFCNSCGRSSYRGADRLWSCQRCVDDRVRPKARYCNARCQRADWLKHKAFAHPTPLAVVPYSPEPKPVTVVLDAIIDHMFPGQNEQ